MRGKAKGFELGGENFMTLKEAAVKKKENKKMKFEIKIQNIDIEYENDLPMWALIPLTINGMLCTYCPSVKIDSDNKTLQIASDYPQLEFWGSDTAWEDEIAPALEAHMHDVGWNDEATTEVNNIVYDTVNAALAKMHENAENYELATPEQRQAADILNTKWYVTVGGNWSKVKSDNGYAVVRDRVGIAVRTKLTLELARQIIDINARFHAFGKARCDNATYLSALLRIIEASNAGTGFIDITKRLRREN